MKLNKISALIMYQNIPLNCRRSYVADMKSGMWIASP